MVKEFLFIGDHALDGGLVGLVRVSAGAEASLALGVLAVAVEQVGLEGVGALDLAGLGEAESLLGAAVGFQLGILGHIC